MIPIKQTVFTNPATGKLGNCFVACLASLLELRLGQIPRFYLMKSGWDKRFDEVLAKHGYKNYGCRNGPPVGLGVDGFFIVAMPVVEHRGYYHCMVWKDGKVVFDPKGYVKVDSRPRNMQYRDIRRVNC